jgi:hypothetical protein
VQTYGPGNIPLETGNAKAHIRRIAQFDQRHRNGPNNQTGKQYKPLCPIHYQTS